MMLPQKMPLSSLSTKLSVREASCYSRFCPPAPKPDLHLLMRKQEFDHGAWLPLFISDKKVLGNLMQAKALLQLDVTAGLFVPLELLVQEVAVSEGGGTDLMYVLPSSLIAGVYKGDEKKKELFEASEKLEDEKLKALVDSVAFGDD